MNIEKIDTRRIIISLCEKDMQDYAVTFESLNLSEKHSKTVLADIMERASETTGIDLKNKKIIIEALRYDTGCLLLLTVARKRKTYHVRYGTESFTFRFPSAEAFLSCIKALYDIQKDRFFSSAYLYDNNYYLVIKTSSRLKDKYINTIAEFSAGCAKGNIFHAFLSEHAKPLHLSNAVRHIGKNL